VYFDIYFPGATLDWSEGNIDAAPLFCDIPDEDYRLTAGSPCRDAGDPAPEYDDACIAPSGQECISSEPSIGTERNDMGAYGGPGACCWYPDSDGDGYYSEGCGGDDCDDADPAVNPGAAEICGNGIDDDCNGLIDDCIFTLELDGSYVSGYLSLVYTIGTPEPVTWANYLILTFPSITIIPLWTAPLPVLAPPIDIPISFPFPSLGVIGIYSGLYTVGGPQAIALEWIYAG